MPSPLLLSPLARIREDMQDGVLNREARQPIESWIPRPSSQAKLSPSHPWAEQ